MTCSCSWSLFEIANDVVYVVGVISVIDVFFIVVSVVVAVAVVNSRVAHHLRHFDVVVFFNVSVVAVVAPLIDNVGIA